MCVCVCVRLRAGPSGPGAGGSQCSRVWGKRGALGRVLGWSHGSEAKTLGGREETLIVPSLSCCGGAPGTTAGGTGDRRWLTGRGDAAFRGV